MADYSGLIDKFKTDDIPTGDNYEELIQLAGTAKDEADNSVVDNHDGTITVNEKKYKPVEDNKDGNITVNGTKYKPVEDNKDNTITVNGKTFAPVIDNQDGTITVNTQSYTPADDSKVAHASDIDKINGEFEGRGVSVKWFGAIGDGTTNDTKAIKDAIAYCTNMAGEVDGEHSYYHGTVFFPKGKYYIGEKLIVSNVTLTGVDKYSSIIVSDTEEAVFSLKMHSTITNLGFEDTVTSNPNGLCNRMLTIENGGEGTTAYFGIRMEHLFFRGQERVKGSDGILDGGDWVSDAIYLDLDNVGLWDLTINDISCNYMHSGLTIDTKNTGWITGSFVNNMLVRGFTGWHTAIISSNNTARQVSQNVFSNLTAEVVYQSAVDGIGFIVSGVGNDWENLILFADGKFSGHAIQLKYYGEGDPKTPSFSQGSSANNAFWGGTLEGDIDDPDGIRELQNFHNMRLQIRDDTGSLQQVNVNDPVHNNLIASDTIAKMLERKSMISLAKTATATNGSDQYGNYLEITTGADTTNWDILFTEPEKVQEVITNGDHSVGVQFKKMTESSEIVGGFLVIDGMPTLGTDIVGRYKNPSIGGELSEYSWVYKKDSDYIASLPDDSHIMDRLSFKIGANSKVRLYNAYLSGGRVIDFSRVTQNNANNAQVDSGGRNYIQSGNTSWLQSDSSVTNQAVKTQGFTISANDIKWMRGKNGVISVDMSITSYDATNVTTRYAANLTLAITFEDGSTISTAAGPVNASQSLIFDRYSMYFKLPDKAIASAQATLTIPSGFTATSYRIGNVMLESGTIAHDYISYIASKDKTMTDDQVNALIDNKIKYTSGTLDVTTAFYKAGTTSSTGALNYAQTGNVLHVSGTVSPSADLAIGSATTLFNLPSSIGTIAENVAVVQQSSGWNLYCLSWSPNGAVSVLKHNTAGTATAITTTTVLQVSADILLS